MIKYVSLVVVMLNEFMKMKCTRKKKNLHRELFALFENVERHFCVWKMLKKMLKMIKCWLDQLNDRKFEKITIILYDLDSWWILNWMMMKIYYQNKKFSILQQLHNEIFKDFRLLLRNSMLKVSNFWNYLAQHWEDSSYFHSSIVNLFHTAFIHPIKIRNHATINKKNLFSSTFASYFTFFHAFQPSFLLRHKFQ